MSGLRFASEAQNQRGMLRNFLLSGPASVYCVRRPARWDRASVAIHRYSAGEGQEEEESALLIPPDPTCTSASPRLDLWGSTMIGCHATFTGHDLVKRARDLDPHELIP